MNAKPTSKTPASNEHVMSNLLWQAGAPFAPAQDSLVASVYEMLWKQIIEGERQQGERLIAGELARELGVSRTPVNQALYQLHQAGLVQASTGRGFHVVILSAEDIRELYDLRIILEVAAVRAAVPNIPMASLQAAMKQIHEMQGIAEHDLGPRFLQSDVQFHHELIAGYCDNRRLAEAIAQQRAQMSLFLIGGTRMPGGIIVALNEHESIVRALLDRDVNLAAAEMEHHIQRVKEDVLCQFATARPPRVRRLRNVSSDL